MAIVNMFGDLTPRQAGYAVKKLLKRYQEITVLERFGTVDAQPKNSGKVRIYRRYNSVPPAVAPLSEGITPAGKKLTFTDVQVTLQEYGDVVNLTNHISEVHNDAVLRETSQILGEQIGETLEMVRYEALKSSGTFVIYSGSAISRDQVAEKISAALFKKAARSLARSKAKKFTRLISATPNVGTNPIAPSYFVLGHTDLKADFESLPGFVPVHKYAKPESAIAGEIGALGSDFRIVLTSTFEPFFQAGADSATMLSNGQDPGVDEAPADVYPILVLARDAYNIVPLQGKNAVKISAFNPGVPRPEDPLGQRGSMGWRLWDALGIINQQFIIRIEAAATANPE